MKSNISIQVKTAFLLLIFAFNMAVSIACFIGVDMGFNTIHHHDEEDKEVHVHPSRAKHEHHNKPANHDHGENNTESKEKGGCCNDSVIKLSQIEKSIPQPYAYVSPIFFTAFIASYYNIDILYPSQITGSVKYFVRNYHPPIPNIRIAIHCFQI
jgi:hypothetical protein